MWMGKTTIILDSVTEIMPFAELKEKLPEMVVQFTGEKYSVPELENAEPDSLNREVELYEKLFRAFKAHGAAEKAHYAIQFVETIFLLQPDDNTRLYDICRMLVDWVLGKDVSLAKYNRIEKAEEKKIMVGFIDKLMKNIPYTPKTKKFPVVPGSGFSTNK